MKSSQRGPLSGIRVLDVSIMAAGPGAGALFGMLGAEVIKVESPTGDSMRHVMPTQRGMDTNFIALNVNKNYMTLDLKNADDHKRALDLASTCDVFVQNFRGGVINRLGLGYDALSRINPRVVYCSISGFGETGPLAEAGCIDTIMQAFAGFACANGAPGKELEAFRFTGFIDLATAAVAVQATLAALCERDQTGRGQKVEVSMLEAALEIQFTRIAELLGAGLEPSPRGSESPNTAPDRAFGALDREIFITTHTDKEWASLCDAIERPDLKSDPRFATTRSRVEHRNALTALLEPTVRERPAIWWLRVLQRYGIPVSIAFDFETFQHHQQIMGNRMIACLQTPSWGEVSVGGPPWHFAKTPCHVREPSPLQERIAGSGQLWATRRRVPPGSSMTTGLQGLRVIELAEGVAGPMASLRLADVGAEVVKIEYEGGDWLRNAAPSQPESNDSAVFVALNRGKEIRVFDTAAQAGEAARALLLQADVFITDRSIAELTALGIPGLDQNHYPDNPRLVSILISHHGEHGPLSKRKGSELTAQAMAGYTRYLGVQGEPACRLGADVGGTGTAIFACQAVFSALLARNRNGRGQRVSVSLVNSLLAMKSLHLAAQSDPDVYAGPRVGGANFPPDRGWKTRDRRIYLTFGGRPGWTEFVKEIGLPHLLDDTRFDKTGRNSTGHGVNAHILHGEYERAFLRYSADDLISIIRKHMGNAGVFQRASEALNHPQTFALKLVWNAQTAERVPYRYTVFPAHFSSLQLRTCGPDRSITSPTPQDDPGNRTAQHESQRGRTNTVAALGKQT